MAGQLLRTIAALACLTMFWAAPTSSAAQSSAEVAAPAIDWRVHSRFRLFSEADGPAAARVEAAMERIGTDDPSHSLAEHHDLLIEALALDGAESLRRSNYRPAEPGGRRGSGRYRRDYLYPESYEIAIRVDEEHFAGRRCRWTSDYGSAEADCREAATLRVGPGRGEGEHWLVERPVRLIVDGGREHAYAVRFNDTLIVALGDSYSSGEGNPDVPSAVTDLPLPVFGRAGWAARLREADGDYRRAVWWDEPCHRSLLSWPVVASLAYAARHPREAVTLVHLGCSGAVAGDLLDRGEIELPGGGDELPGETQLAQLDRLLRAAPPGAALRRPDRVLLSLGGNDSGFVGVLATIVLPPGGYMVPLLGPIAIGREADAICPYRNSGRQLERLCGHQRSAEERLERLPGSYDRLAGALSRRGAARVHHFLYPNPISAPDGLVCDIRATRDPERPEEMSGFEAFMGTIPPIFRGRHYSWDFELQYFPERVQGDRLMRGVDCDWHTDPDDSEVCQALWVYSTLNRRVAENAVRPGWTIVGGHVEKVAGHGICARAPAFLPALPRVRDGQWIEHWSPQSRRAYHADNPRWFRLPNDSVVIQYADPDHFYHGSFHPTFRAHLEYANAARDALED